MSDNDTPEVQVAPQGQAEPTEGASPEAVGVDTNLQGAESTTFEQVAAKKGWKSPDDMAKAYQHLESHNTKTSQEKANLEKLFFQEQKPQSVKTDAPVIQDDAVQELDRFVRDRANEALSQAEQKFKQEVRRLELRQVIKENPDFASYAQDVKELQSKYPEMSFTEAYTFAKAVKGDLAQESRSEGMMQAAKIVQSQKQAQVAPTKPSKEEKIAPDELLQGAGSRWAPKPRGGVDSRSVAEIEQLEKELFGQVLQKTNIGL